MTHAVSAPLVFPQGYRLSLHVHWLLVHLTDVRCERASYVSHTHIYMALLARETTYGHAALRKSLHRKGGQRSPLSEQHEAIGWARAARLIQALYCGASAMCTLAHFHSSFFFHPAPNLSPALRNSVLRTANSLHVLRWSPYKHGTASVSYAYFGHRNVSVLRSHFHFGHSNVSVLRPHFRNHVTRSSELACGAPFS